MTLKGKLVIAGCVALVIADLFLLNGRYMGQAADFLVGLPARLGFPQINVPR